MKKMFFLLIISLMLVACTGLSKKDSSDFNYVGKLEVIEMSTWMYGTHTITTDEGEFFAVTADNIELNEYNGSEVMIAGTVVDGYPVENGPVLIKVNKITKK